MTSLSSLSINRDTLKRSRLQTKWINICKNIPDCILLQHGYHRACYQRFTVNQKRLQPCPLQDEKVDLKKSNRRLSVNKESCIFCDKDKPIYTKSGGIYMKEHVQTFTVNGWQNVVRCAENKSDASLLLKIRNSDLFATKAKFYKICHKPWPLEECV